MRSGLTIAAAGMLLAGCNTIQNHYVDASGKHGSGTTTFGATQENVKFSIRDEKSTCTGSTDNWRSMTVVIPITCTDGKSGTVMMTRPLSGLIAGEGTMQLASGEVRRIMFGPK